VNRTLGSKHDSARASWVESANDPATDFPIQNLPFGCFRSSGTGPCRIGVAIGGEVLDQRRASHGERVQSAAGDLFGSRTLSGPEPDQGGSLLELTTGGKHPLRLGNGEVRAFLEDGDCIVMRAYCERPGFRRIGFGECAGTMVPAPPPAGHPA
jgi:hypothetical protein